MAPDIPEQNRAAVSLVWQIFQEEMAKGNDRETAEETAMTAVFPSESDPSHLLGRWKVQGLWPPEHPAFRPTFVGANDQAGLDSDDAQDRDIPASWMDTIVGLIRTTVNAAILDYHNVQGDQVAKEIELIKETIARIAEAPGVAQPVDVEELVELAVKSLEERISGVSIGEGGVGVASGEPREAGPEQSLPEPASRRRKLHTTCDAVLLGLFERECKRWGFTTEQMLDHVLHNYFGRVPPPSGS